MTTAIISVLLVAVTCCCLFVVGCTGKEKPSGGDFDGHSQTSASESVKDGGAQSATSASDGASDFTPWVK